MTRAILLKTQVTNLQIHRDQMKLANKRLEIRREELAELNKQNKAMFDLMKTLVAERNTNNGSNVNDMNVTYEKKIFLIYLIGEAKR